MERLNAKLLEFENVCRTMMFPWDSNRLNPQWGIPIGVDKIAAGSIIKSGTMMIEVWLGGHFMDCAIVFSSMTGNTALLAEKIAAALPDRQVVYSGPPSPDVPQADIIFAGFWTDKGSCDEQLAGFLKGLRNKKVFLFGTAGFGGSQDYFDQILDRVRLNLHESNEVTGVFMCQGKMPSSVRERYELMAAQGSDKAKELIENFDAALIHPDTGDLNRLEDAVKAVLNK